MGDQGTCSSGEEHLQNQGEEGDSSFKPMEKSMLAKSPDPVLKEAGNK